MDQHKQLIFEIHEFVKMQDIKSFHCIAFGICDDVTLVEIQDCKNPVEPKLHILLDPNIQSHRQDKFKLRQRFPLTKILMIR